MEDLLMHLYFTNFEKINPHMRRILLIALSFLGTLSAFAQTRYLEPVFDGVLAQQDSTVYQANFSFLPVLIGATSEEIPLQHSFQTYMPAGDTETNRPVVILNTTGSFLPQFVGGGVFGTLKDSAVVNTANRLAKMGYVAIIAQYRQGWVPTAFGSPQADDIRIGSLLTAAYKGIQDNRSLARFLRMTVANQGNPLGIDPDRIAIMGFGTGGYNAYGTNYLDSSQEVFDVPKFFSPNSGLSFLDTARYGDPDGLTAKPFNLVNHAGFDSRFQFAVGIGGALGDTSWIDGNPNEAATVGIHWTADLNAPFTTGDVFVPVAGNNLFVINAAGARATVDVANNTGVNDGLDDLNAALSAAQDFVTLRSEALEDVTVQVRGATTTATVPNMYAFLSPEQTFEANTYNYIDSFTLSLFVAGFQAATGDTTTTATYLSRERFTNPNITNPAAANLVIDTMMAFITPRMFVGLDLGTADDVVQFLDVVDITAADVDFKVFPNPTSDFATIEVRDDVELQLIALYDINGRRVSHAKVSGNRYGFDSSNLPTGMYTLLVQTSEGALSERILVK